MLGLCVAEGVGVIPWSPLARGRLTRAWDERDATKRAETDEFGKKIFSQSGDADRAIIDRLGEVAAARGVPRAQVALAWLLSKPGVTAPIIGVTKPHHLEDGLAALEIELTAEEVARLEALYEPHPVIGIS